MGMYTELVMAANIKKGAPEDFMNSLKAIFDGSDREVPSDHELFKTLRWMMLAHGDSYYFDGFAHSEIRYDDILSNYGNGWTFIIRANIKNYDDEIEKFIDFVMPWVDAIDGEFLGYYRYEEDYEPTLIYKK